MNRIEAAGYAALIAVIVYGVAATVALVWVVVGIVR